VDAVEQALRADTKREIQAVFAVHTDTAGSVTSPVEPLRRALDAVGHPALLVVDVVASLGAAPFAMDELGVDVAVGASQKGLMCPPGVAFMGVNARAFEVARGKGKQSPRFYWDWVRRNHAMSYMKFCGTPPQNLLMGMEAALGLMFAEGLPALWKRHADMAAAVHAAVEGWREGGALDFFAQDPASRCVSVTTITVPQGTDVEALRATARERFQVAMAGGLGPLTGRAFRIGHLGDTNPAMILGALAGVEAALLAHGIPVGDGGVQRAVRVLAQAGQHPAQPAAASA
jgi:alanine-glyoxylate transaminase/serine-glyoxylate transaminase/serine-pyruvate transaminase